jgi:hypothetical protein
MALNFPGVPSNGMPISRARTVAFFVVDPAGGDFCGSRAWESNESKSKSKRMDVDLVNIAKFSRGNAFLFSGMKQRI